MVDRLQMIAELIDKNVGANAKKIERAFADLGKAHSRDLPAAFKKYQSAVIRQEKELEHFTKRSAVIRREIEAFKGIVARTTPMVFELTKSVGSFTLGSGAAVGAIAAVGAALYEAGKVAAEFSESMRQIKFGSAETGLGQLQIKQLTQALGEFGLDASEVSQGFVGLRRAMTEMSAHTGIFKEKLGALGSEIFNYANPIIDEAKREGTTTAKVYAEIRKQLDRISADHPDDPALAHDLRRRLVEGMGMSPKFALAGEAAMQEKLAVVKALGTTSEEMHESVEAADRFNVLMDDGRVALDKWLTNLGTGVIKVLLFVNETLNRLGLDKTRALGMLLAPLTGGVSAGASALFDAWVKSHPGLTPFAEGGIVTKPTVALIGEKGPEAVIPLRALNFIKAIGRSETDFNKGEAYSDRLNSSDNNVNVKKYGRSGADYGYFQMNQRDVGDAIRRGVAPETAGHLAGGSQSTFAPASDLSTESQQTGAMNEYIKRRYAKQYSALVAGGSFENMRRAVTGQWFGMKDHAKEAEAEFNMSLGGRMSINSALGAASAINSSGQLDVSVRAPRGTSVKAEGGGIFEKTNVRRNIQMQTAPGGPPQ